MNLAIAYLSSNVPAYFQDLDEDHLRTVWQQGASYYAIDSKSSYPLKKGFLRNSEYIFRFKYSSSSGSVFYFVAVERKVPTVDRNSARPIMVDGVEILKCATVKDGKLLTHTWRDDFLPIQGDGDPMFKLVTFAKQYESKSAPFYLSLLG